MRKTLLLILALAGVAVLSGFDYSGDCSAANGGCQTGDNWIAANGNEVAIALNALEGKTFDSALYDQGDGVGGLANAVAACEATSGGIVLAATSPTTVIRSSATDIPPLTKCSIEGFGSSPQGSPAPYVVGASVYRLNGTSSTPFIRITGSGVSVRSIGIEFLTDAATNIGIQTSDGTPAQNLVSGVDIVDVVISGQTQGNSSGGVGIDFEDCIKCIVQGGEYKRMTAGIRYGGQTQASPLFAVKTRENQFGIECASDMNAVQAVQPMFGNTSEGNIQQIRTQAGCNATFNLHGTYFEPSTVGVQSERAGILNASQNAFFHLYSVTFIAANDRLDPGRDFVQTVATTGGSFEFGPHTFHGVKWISGMTMTADARNEAIIRDSVRVGAGTYAPVFTGGRIWGGSTYYASTSCATEMANEARFFPGDECFQGSGASVERWGCLDPDGVTANGYCDNAAEIIEFPGGGGGSSTFLGLSDVNESTYTGSEGRPVVVNGAGDALEFTADVPGSNALTLDDNPTGTRPGTPAAGTGIIYAVDDGNLYYKNDAGTESQLNGAGGGGVVEIYKNANETIDFGNILSDQCVNFNTSAIGVVADDIVDWNFDGLISGSVWQPQTTGGLALHGYAATGQITWEVCNTTASAVNPPVVTLQVKVHR